MNTYIVFKDGTASRGLATVVHAVRSAIPGAHLATHSDIVLNAQQVMSLYGDVPRAIQAETVKRLAGVELTVIQVTGDATIVETLAHLRGDHVDPRECARGTLRRMLADDSGCTPVELEGGFYYPNFIHIPQNLQEAMVCENLFKTYFCR